MLHHGSGTYTLRILRGLIPTLNPGARVLNEPVIPDPSDAAPEDAADVRANDLVVPELQKGCDREVADWKLFAEAHRGFRFRGGNRLPAS